jgi:glycosyltransferase involved in cell wall biosynthesis
MGTTAFWEAKSLDTLKTNNTRTPHPSPVLQDAGQRAAVVAPSDLRQNESVGRSAKSHPAEESMSSAVVSNPPGVLGTTTDYAVKRDLTKGANKPRQEAPLVSVIIPCFNGEAFLKEAIESVLAQSYPRVEIIVVDDGSTDHSGEIAQSYAVRYIHQANRGLTASRNLGIQESRGSYLVFLDADDRLMPKAIEAGLRVLVHRPECALTVGDHLFVSEDGSYLANSRKTFPRARHYEALLKSNLFEMISSILFRRSIFDQVGGFDPDLRVAEDYDLYLRIARDHPICFHPALVAEYRIHESNTSRNSELMLTTTLQVLRRQALYVRRNPRRLVAFLEGLRGWRRQYGRQLASEMARSSPIWKVDRRKLLLLLNCYPQGLMVFLLLRVMPSATQRDARNYRQFWMDKKLPSQRVHGRSNAVRPQSWRAKQSVSLAYAGTSRTNGEMTHE